MRFRIAAVAFSLAGILTVAALFAALIAATALSGAALTLANLSVAGFGAVDLHTLGSGWFDPVTSGSRKHEDPKTVIEIDPLKNRLRLYRNGQLIKIYPIALGKPETPSPVGDFKVIEKHLNWGGGFGSRWIGLNVPWGTYGIHGTNRPHSIGSDASHGCVRMLNKQVEELYPLVSIGTPVRILGHALGEPHSDPRTLVEGMTGSDVQLVQSRLRNAGFFKARPNGKFGPATVHALRAYQKANRLPVDGTVGFTDYFSLGLLE